MKIPAIFIIIVLLCSCSKEEKAKKAIKEYLSKTMNDFDSYEPVEFGKMDSIITNDNRYAKKMYKFWKDKREKLKEDLKGRPNDPVIIDSIKVTTALMNYKKSNFIGYKIFHSFRGNNSVGAKIISGGNFVLDTTLNKVINFIDLNNDKD